MAKKPTLTVTTEFGTFTRQTDRTYTHLVIASGRRHELLEANRLAGVTFAKKQIAGYERDLQDVPAARAKGDGRPWGEWFTTEWLQDALAKTKAGLAELEAGGPITEDQGAGTFTVISWNGRLDLARKEAQGTTASRYRTVHVIEVATGKVVA